MKILVSLVGAVLLAGGVLITPATAQEQGVFFGGPPGPGVAITVYSGGSVAGLHLAAPNAQTFFVTIEGAFVGYLIGAPEFVNQDFIQHFAAGIPANTPMIVLSAPYTTPTPDKSSALYMVNTDGSDLTELWSTSGDVPTFAWSPEGHSIAVSAWPDSASLVDVDTGHRTPLAARGNILSWTPDGSLVAIQDAGTVALVSPDGTEVAFQARGSQVRWAESGNVAFFGGLDYGSGLVVAAHMPDGWAEVADYPDVVQPAIDVRTGRYAIAEAATVRVGEVVTAESGLPTEIISSFDIPDAVPETQLQQLIWSPDAEKLALLRWEAGDTDCHTDSFTGIFSCRTGVLDLELVLIDLATGQVSQRSSTVGLLPAPPTLWWRDSDTLIWGVGVFDYGAEAHPAAPRIPSSEGLGVEIVTGPFGEARSYLGVPSPDGALLAVPGNFASEGSGVQIWPRASDEGLWYDPELGWWVMRLEWGAADSLRLEWSPDSTRIAVMVSGDVEAVVPSPVGPQD